MKRAFTLIEVNLAMLIMAGGIFAIVGLYAFGFRESRQSTEDVASAAYADAVLSPLVMAITSTNIKWSTFNSFSSQPSDYGWSDYFDNNTGLIKGDPEAKAKQVYNFIIGRFSDSKVNMSWPTDAAAGLKAGLVVLHDRDSAVVKIGFRASKLPSMLMSAPFYYTEARFQGVVDQ